jgi:hypothetical protein
MMEIMAIGVERQTPETYGKKNLGGHALEGEE